MTAHQVISLSQIHIYIGYNIWLLANPIHTYGHIRCAFIAHAPDRLKNQGCCSTVYGTVYGNTVRYGKNVFYRIFEIWHRIYGKIRYCERCQAGTASAKMASEWPLRPKTSHFRSPLCSSHVLTPHNASMIDPEAGLGLHQLGGWHCQCNFGLRKASPPQTPPISTSSMLSL